MQVSRGTVTLYYQTHQQLPEHACVVLQAVAITANPIKLSVQRIAVIKISFEIITRVGGFKTQYANISLH